MARRQIVPKLVLIFIPFFVGRDMAVASNCTATLCDMRYELAAEVHALLNYKTCSDVYVSDCICNRTLDIQFIEHPPYIYTDTKTGKVVGLLTGKSAFLTEFFLLFCRLYTYILTINISTCLSSFATARTMQPSRRILLFEGSKDL